MLSTCTKCGGHLFELFEQSPAGSNFKLQFVQCSQCGVPISAMEYYSLGTKLEDVEKEVAQLKLRLGDIQNVLVNVENSLRNLR